MISRKKNFIFVHVPKTGGSSIQNILMPYSDDKIVNRYQNQDGVERFAVENPKYQTKKHSPLSHYWAHMKALGELDLFKSMYKFATIRNPWEMMISYFFSPHRGKQTWNREEFVKLVHQVQSTGSYLKIPSVPQRIAHKIGWKGCTLCVSRIDADIDFIMRVEHLNDDFAKVCKELSISFEKLPVRNKSSRNHYSTYYDDETIELVQRKFSEVIEYGEYDFESES